MLKNIFSKLSLFIWNSWKIKILLSICVVLLSQLFHPVIAAETADDFFLPMDNFLSRYVHQGKVDYMEIKNNPGQLKQIISVVENFDIENLKQPNMAKAFWINAYNILVIRAVVEAYPIKSPLDVKGFFDKKKHTVAGERLTLNEIENIKLREEFSDPRIHFVLVCAAVSCPPIIDKIFTPANTEQLLEERTRINLNDDNFIRMNENKKTVKISELFKWYKQDFLQGGLTLIGFINQFRHDKIPEESTVNYYPYDWTLNDYREDKSGRFIIDRENLQAYTPSTLLLPGQIELKQFNNLYTQTAFFDQDGEKVDLNNRSTYYTGIIYFLYGFKSRVNIGFDLYFKAVHNSELSGSPFSVFQFSGMNSRSSLTSIVPKVKFTPISQLNNLSLQTLLLIPLAEGLEAFPFLEYDDVQWWTQLFYDLQLKDQFLIYLESGLYLRFDSNETVPSTPLKLILNYYPSDRWTFYLPTEIFPNWDNFSWSSYFFQAGIGGKYQITANIELELLYTRFLLGKQSGAGLTYNLGFRFIY
jgi:hypothetical protein